MNAFVASLLTMAAAALLAPRTAAQNPDGERTQAEIQRFVTLSPKTDMAHRFHIGNGAGILRENASTINYEYHLD